MQVKKQQLELDVGQHIDSKSGKEYIKAVYCHPAYLTFIQTTSYEMPSWTKHKLEEAQAGIKIAGQISTTSDTKTTPPLWQKAKKN